MDNDIFYTGLRICGQKIFIESTRDQDVDVALKSVFYSDYRKNKPLDMSRDDVKIVLEWMNNET